MPETLSASPSSCNMNTNSLLSLSDEVLLLIVQQLDRHDSLLQARLTCRKLKDLSETYMFRNVMLTLEEEVSKNWSFRLQCVPEGISKTKQLSILNQSRIPGRFFHPNCVPQRHSYRILRWRLLEEAAEASEAQFSQAAFFKGSLFNWKVRLAQDQLSTFHWRHATTLSLSILRDILLRHSGTLEDIEISMISPPIAEEIKDFVEAIAPRTFEKLHTLTYNGLSHTEPIPANFPEKGGRFRMLRPIVRKTYTTLKTLKLSQDHCISQVGKTPLINGRVYDSFSCDLDELYTHPQDPCDSSQPAIVLNVTCLELGGFKVSSLFDTPLSPTASPRVRIQLSALCRLVLNDCDYLSPLLQELSIRNEAVRLTEFAVRVQEDFANQDYLVVSKSLTDFLVSFKGLEILSVLWDGSKAPRSSDILAALSHHSQTLQVYSFVPRSKPNFGNMDSHLRFAHKALECGVHAKALLPDERPKLKEFSFNLHSSLISKDCPSLKLLSQFDTLRTVHIRNFPPFSNLSVDKSKNFGFWRDQEGIVTKDATKIASEFAEAIALPFYALPTDMENDNEVTELISPCLQTLADQNAAKRDQKLYGRSKVGFTPQTSVPIRDITRQILEQRAKLDPHFANVKQKVENDTASVEDETFYDGYVDIVRKTFGYTKPDDIDKPKLRLLIIGEWRYRDQLNLTGPRSWDPSAWYSGSASTAPDLSDIDEYSDDDDDVQRGTQVHHASGSAHHKLRGGFRMEYDVSLLPIFFAVNWKPERKKRDNKWRWKAHVQVLDHTTLEGNTTLENVRSLDFATQN